jgi:sulfur relay (sulfurtransferase) DsrC/TusE family protein
MLRTIIIIIVLLSFQLKALAQDIEDNRVLWQLLTLTPNNEHIDSLQNNLRTFIKKFNSEGKCKSWVLTISTGPKNGQLILERGPFNLSDLDNPCFTNGKDFWNERIMPNVIASKNEFFEQYKAMDYSVENSTNLFNVQYVRMFEVKYGMENEFQELLQNIRKQISENKLFGHWAFFRNFFEKHNNGQDHFAIVTYYNNLEELSLNFASMDLILDVETKQKLKNFTVYRIGFILK